MIKEMKGYKVIGEDRYSCRARHWELSDDYDGREWAVLYLPHRETFPNQKGSKLFFFEELETANDFVGSSTEFVVPCVAKNVTKVKWVGAKVDEMIEFWKKRRKAESKMAAPVGTYLAESITCLE